MLELFGSQFGLIICICIGVGAYWVIKQLSGDKSKGEDDGALGCLLVSGGIGFVVMIVCFVLSQCSRTD